MLSIYRSGEIGLVENLDIVHIRLLVEPQLPIGVATPALDGRVVLREEALGVTDWLRIQGWGESFTGGLQAR